MKMYSVVVLMFTLVKFTFSAYAKTYPLQVFL